MICNSEIDFYVDTLIAEIILSNNLSKTAQSGVMSSFIDKAKNYFSNNIDPNNKAGSIINILAPGAMFVALKAMGFGWIGMLLAMAMDVFHVDVSGILGSICQSLKSEISSGNSLTSSQVQSTVDQAVQAHSGADNQPAYDQSVAAALKQAKYVKLALISYEIDKTAAGKWDKSSTTSVLSKILGWLFSIALASAGFLVAGDIVNKFLGRPNAFDQKTYTAALPKDIPSENNITSTQTLFKVNPSYYSETYPDGWAVSAPNTENGITDLLIRFTHDVYDGVNDADIKSSPTFNKIVNDVAWYNHTAAGDQIVYLPDTFTSKKNLVDHFIDEVAKKSAA